MTAPSQAALLVLAPHGQHGSAPLKSQRGGPLYSAHSQ